MEPGSQVLFLRDGAKYIQENGELKAFFGGRVVCSAVAFRELSLSYLAC